MIIRLWKNNDLFAEKIAKTLEVGCLSGQPLNVMCDYLVDEVIGSNTESGQRYITERLVRTETNYFANQGIKIGLQKAGYEKYRFVATLDMRTSDICESMDGKEFLLSEANAGENYPPMHPNCRSVVSPVDERVDRSKATRSARDHRTGKSIKVPANMTYQEWYKQFVEGKEQEIFINEQNRNISKSDREQYERYCDILGKKAPNTIDDFFEIKYNSIKYEELKLKYKDKKLQRSIRSNYNLIIHRGKQDKHIKNSNNYIDGRSYLTISIDEAQKLVDKYAGTGIINRDINGKWKHTETIVSNDKIIGNVVLRDIDNDIETAMFKIHYSKKGTHIVPYKEGKL